MIQSRGITIKVLLNQAQAAGILLRSGLNTDYWDQLKSKCYFYIYIMYI